MGQLITTDPRQLQKAVTNAQPAMVVGGFAGEPNFIIALKGQQPIDEIWWNGVGGSFASISGTKSDVAPALVLLNVFLSQTLYLAWKDSASTSVKVMQF